MKTFIGGKRSVVFLLSLCGLLAGVTHAEKSQPWFRTSVETGMTFQTNDKQLQKLFDTAVTKLKGNLVRFTPSMKVLVEGGGRDGYGPMILAALEYINRMHGIYLDVERDRVWWSGLADGGRNFTYHQRRGDTTWVLECKDGRLSATINGKESFTASAGARIVTGLDGQPVKIVGIDPQERQVTVKTESSQWKLLETYFLDISKTSALLQLSRYICSLRLSFSKNCGNLILPFFDYLEIKSLFQLHSSRTKNNSDSLSISSLFSYNLTYIFRSNLQFNDSALYSVQLGNLYLVRIVHQ